MKKYLCATENTYRYFQYSLEVILNSILYLFQIYADYFVYWSLFHERLSTIATSINHEPLAVHCMIYTNCFVTHEKSKFLFPFLYPFSLEPNEELVKVIGLKHGVQIAGPNNTFSTTVWWEKPLFKHSGVKHYVYKVLPVSDQTRLKGDNNAGFQTVS